MEQLGIIDNITIRIEDFAARESWGRFAAKRNLKIDLDAKAASVALASRSAPNNRGINNLGLSRRPIPAMRLTPLAHVIFVGVWVRGRDGFCWLW